MPKNLLKNLFVQRINFNKSYRYTKFPLPVHLRHSVDSNTVEALLRKGQEC